MTSCAPRCAKYAARSNGLTAVPVIHGNEAVVTMAMDRPGSRIERGALGSRDVDDAAVVSPATTRRRWRFSSRDSPPLTTGIFNNEFIASLDSGNGNGGGGGGGGASFGNLAREVRVTAVGDEGSDDDEDDDPSLFTTPPRLNPPIGFNPPPTRRTNSERNSLSALNGPSGAALVAAPACGCPPPPTTMEVIVFSNSLLSLSNASGTLGTEAVGN